LAGFCGRVPSETPVEEELVVGRSRTNGGAQRSPTLSNLGMRILTIIKRYW